MLPALRARPGPLPAACPLPLPAAHRRPCVLGSALRLPWERGIPQGGDMPQTPAVMGSEGRSVGAAGRGGNGWLGTPVCLASPRHEDYERLLEASQRRKLGV